MVPHVGPDVDEGVLNGRVVDEARGAARLSRPEAKAGAGAASI